MAREVRETRETRRQPSGRTEFLSRANPLPQLPRLASSPTLISPLSVLPGGSASRPLRGARVGLAAVANPAIPPRAGAARPPLTRPAIFADTSGSEAAAPHSAEPAPAARVPASSPPSRRRAAAGRPRPRPAASPAPFPSPCARAQAERRHFGWKTSWHRPRCHPVSTEAGAVGHVAFKGLLALCFQAS